MLDRSVLRLGAAEQARRVAAGTLDVRVLRELEGTERQRLAESLNAFIGAAGAVPGLPPESEPAAEDDAAATTELVGPTPLAGVSVAVKDNIDVAGEPSSCGLRALGATPARHDACAVARLRRAGLVPCGKTNMAAMALGASTHNVDFGDCHNPLRPGYSAGGSSGGSASAVAAGLCGIALGTDTMGSVRIPAAFCGIVGFKPTWGVLPVAGVVPLSRQLDHVGVLGRRLEDVALAYRSMRGTASLAAQAEAPGDTVLAMPAALALSVGVQRAFDDARRRLMAAGYRMRIVDFHGFDAARTRRAGLLVCEAELLNVLSGVYPEQRERLPAELVALLDFAAGKRAADIGRSLALLAQSRDWLQASCDGVDALILPTSPHLAFSMQDPVPADTADLSAIANVMGAPALSLPLPAAAGELPAGLQLIGRYQRDEALLALAAQIEPLLAD